MELGGNISLQGFDGKDFTEMIVIKKIVGQYARRLSDTVPDFSSLSVTLSEGDKPEIKTTAVIDSKDYSSTEAAHNLFMALDNSLKGVSSQVNALKLEH